MGDCAQTGIAGQSELQAPTSFTLRTAATLSPPFTNNAQLIDPCAVISSVQFSTYVPISTGSFRYLRPHSSHFRTASHSPSIFETRATASVLHHAATCRVCAGCIEAIGSYVKVDVSLALHPCISSIRSRPGTQLIR